MMIGTTQKEGELGVEKKIKKNLKGGLKERIYTSIISRVNQKTAAGLW